MDELWESVEGEQQQDPAEQQPWPLLLLPFPPSISLSAWLAEAARPRPSLPCRAEPRSAWPGCPSRAAAGCRLQRSCPTNSQGDQQSSQPRRPSQLRPRPFLLPRGLARRGSDRGCEQRRRPARKAAAAPVAPSSRVGQPAEQPHRKPYPKSRPPQPEPVLPVVFPSFSREKEEEGSEGP